MQKGDVETREKQGYVEDSAGGVGEGREKRQSHAPWRSSIATEKTVLGNWLASMRAEATEHSDSNSTASMVGQQRRGRGEVA